MVEGKQALGRGNRQAGPGKREAGPLRWAGLERWAGAAGPAHRGPGRKVLGRGVRAEGRGKRWAAGLPGLVWVRLGFCVFFSFFSISFSFANSHKLV